MNTMAEVAVPTETAQSITARDLLKKIEAGEKINLVDVRTTTEFRSGHIAKAINVPMDEFESRYADIPEDAETVLICGSSRRASMVQEQCAASFGDTTCLEGGMEAWNKESFPTIASTRTRMALDRQALTVAAIMILVSVALALTVNFNWIYLALLPGFGLLTAGLTGFCLMGIILGKAPWNQPRTEGTN